jgi:hypothetical protein
MAFCNSCGANLENGAKFCAKCGASQPLGAAAPMATAPATGAAPAQGNAVRIVLIIVFAIVALGVLGIGTMSYIAYRVARHSRIQKDNGNVKIESPVGTFESTNNPDDIAHNLGIDIYPGSRIVNGNAANVTVGGMHTVAAQFESDDPPSQVAGFYRAKLPNANVNVANQDHYSIVSTDKNNLFTINIEPSGSKTLIHIANVSGKNIGKDSSSD